MKNLIAGGKKPPKIDSPAPSESEKKNEKREGASIEKKNSFRKTMSTTSRTDECMKKGTSVTDPELLSRLESLVRPITREVRPTKEPALPTVPTASYLDSNGNINYRRLLTDEVLATDRLLIEAAKKSMDVAGKSVINKKLHKFAFKAYIFINVRKVNQ